MPQPQFIPSPLKIIEGHAGARLRSQNDDDRHRANGARHRSAHVRMRSMRVMRKSCLSNSDKPPQSLHQKGRPVPLGGLPMTILSDQNRHPGFLQSGQLTLFGAAIIVLLIFASSYAF